MTHINEKLRIMGLDGAFCQKIKLLIARFSLFFAKRRKSVEKMIQLSYKGSYDFEVSVQRESIIVSVDLSANAQQKEI